MKIYRPFYEQKMKRNPGLTHIAMQLDVEGWKMNPLSTKVFVLFTVLVILLVSITIWS